jgi:hypothetical protein
MGLSDLIESLKRKAMSCDWLTDRMHNKTSKRTDISSDTDGNQLATGNKKRRLVKGFNKDQEDEEDEEEEEEEGEDEDDLHQDTDEDSRKPSAVVKEEEDETKDGEGILQLDRDEWEDSKQPPAAVKEEEGYGYDETEENEVGYETDENEGGEDALHLDRDEPKDCKKLPAVVNKEVKDEVGHEYSPREIDKKSNWEQLATREGNDDEATYLPDEITSTKDAFGRGKRTPIDEASDTSDSVGWIADQDEAIFSLNDVKWNKMYERLRAFKESHGDCEFF